MTTVAKVPIKDNIKEQEEAKNVLVKGFRIGDLD